MDRYIVWIWHAALASVVALFQSLEVVTITTAAPEEENFTTTESFKKNLWKGRVGHEKATGDFFKFL